MLIFATRVKFHIDISDDWDNTLNRFLFSKWSKSAYRSSQSVKRKLSYDLFYYFMGQPNNMLIFSKPQAVPHNVINRSNPNFIFTRSFMISSSWGFGFWLYFMFLARICLSREAPVVDQDHRQRNILNLGLWGQSHK